MMLHMHTYKVQQFHATRDDSKLYSRHTCQASTVILTEIPARSKEQSVRAENLQVTQTHGDHVTLRLFSTAS